jgi:hypothetical protein
LLAELASHTHAANPIDLPGGGHTHALSVNEGTHSHTVQVSDSGHFHTFNGTSHGHGINDSHLHTFNSTGQHNHGYFAGTYNIGLDTSTVPALILAGGTVTTQQSNLNFDIVNPAIAFASGFASVSVTTAGGSVVSASASIAQVNSGLTGTGFSNQTTTGSGIAITTSISVNNTPSVAAASHNNVQPTMVLQHMIFLGRA